jgi:hypothetical protein
MMSASRPDVEAVRLSIANAVSLPKMIEPPPRRETGSVLEDSNLPRLVGADGSRDHPRTVRHLAQRFAEALPLGFCGLADAAAGGGLMRYGVAETLYLYRDLNQLARAFNLAGHAREGVASLFGGDDRLLARLWPGRRGGWDPITAAETLVCQQGRVGVVRGNGFGHAEDALVQRGHLAISQLARRQLRRGTDPYRVLDLARRWNATRGQSALSDEIVMQIVDAACGRALRSFEEDREIDDKSSMPGR